MNDEGFTIVDLHGDSSHRGGSSWGFVVKNKDSPDLEELMNDQGDDQENKSGEEKEKSLITEFCDTKEIYEEKNGNSEEHEVFDEEDGEKEEHHGDYKEEEHHEEEEEESSDDDDKDGEDFAADKKQRRIYDALVKIYQPSEDDKDNLIKLKDEILSYEPGQYIYNRSGMRKHHYRIPEVTTLLLVGSKGSGKSKLVNNVMKLFGTGCYFVDRAPESYSSVGPGTLFLKEHNVPTDGPSFCIYDSRSLSDDIDENLENIKIWMTRGVRHGEPVFRKSDDEDACEAIACRGRQLDHLTSTIRAVNYVIFVVSGVSVMDAMIKCNKEYFEKLAQNFHCPYLSFRDDRPIVVVTHGDLLQLSDRVVVIMHLAEVLSISPFLIYDIPDKWNTQTKLTILNLLVDALEHADKNLPLKKSRDQVRDEEGDMLLLAFVVISILYLFLFSLV